MAIKYTWDCKTVSTYPTASNSENVEYNDVIHEAHWSLKAHDVINGVSQSYSSIGVQTLDTSNLSTEFISFENIKHSDIIGWVTSSMNSTDENAVANLKNAVSQSMIDIAYPKSVIKTIE